MQAVKHELRALGGAVRSLCEVQEALGPGIDRLAKLESARHQFEAQCEGLLLKAEGKFKAANNAEARERANKRSYEHLLDPLAEIGDPGEAPVGDPVQIDHAAASEAERLQALRLDVAPTHRELATRAKFGVT